MDAKLLSKTPRWAAWNFVRIASNLRFFFYLFPTDLSCILVPWLLPPRLLAFHRCYP